MPWSIWCNLLPGFHYWLQHAPAELSSHSFLAQWQFPCAFIALENTLGCMGLTAVSCAAQGAGGASAAPAGARRGCARRSAPAGGRRGGRAAACLGQPRSPAGPLLDWRPAGGLGNERVSRDTLTRVALTRLHAHRKYPEAPGESQGWCMYHLTLRWLIHGIGMKPLIASSPHCKQHTNVSMLHAG